MKTNKFWSIMLMLVFMFGTSTVLSSCGGDDDDVNDGITNKDNDKDKDDDKSEPVDNTPAGVEAVDLGLPNNVKWASMNIGASKPEEFGEYFAWGETEGSNSGKTEFLDNNYKWYPDGTTNSLTKYTIADGYKDRSWYSGDTFIGDNKTILDLTGSQIDDTARAKWGGKWRMPTMAEMEDLLKFCDWTWVQMNGKWGYKVSSRTNENYIFLPATGFWKDTTKQVGSYGYYWCSTLNMKYSAGADALYFYDKDKHTDHFGRSRGITIRAVCQ